MHVLTAAWIRASEKVFIRVELLPAYASDLRLRYALLSSVAVSLPEEEGVEIVQILICDFFQGALFLNLLCNLHVVLEAKYLHNFEDAIPLLFYIDVSSD